jgi:hypothetical protein
MNKELRFRVWDNEQTQSRRICKNYWEMEGIIYEQ